MFVSFDLFHFQIDVAIDLIKREHITRQEVIVIRLELFHRFAQATANCWNTGQFLRRKIV